MKFLDLTLPTPEQNLACDEALMDWCEDAHDEEILRFWEPREYFIVIGYSSKSGSEVNLQACRKSNISVLRRLSGGGPVLQGPGCLNYTLILKVQNSGPFKTIDGTYSFVMRHHQQALQPILGSDIRLQGFSDLSLGSLKFSGNAQYRRQRSLLFHGTFLLRLDIELMEKLLPVPSRTPPYREGRSHKEFLTDLNIPAPAIKEALQNSWGVTDPFRAVPFARIDALAAGRYSAERWNFKF